MKEIGASQDVFNFWCKFRKIIANNVPDHLKTKEHNAIKNLLEERSEVIRSARRQLANIKEGSGGVPTLVDEMNLKLLDLESKIQSLNKGLNLPFQLVIVGMGKVGKSSLINALITKRVADMDVLPKTWKTDVFMRSSDTNADIVYRDGNIKSLHVDEVNKIVSQEESAREKSEDIIADKYNELSGKLDKTEDKEQLKRELNQKYLYRSNIREIRWPVLINNPASILENYVVVDTPGLWQANGGDQREDISDYYHQSDGVIWVLDATTLQASKPKKILDELDFALKKAGVKRFGNIIAVLNRIDAAVPDGNLDEIKRIVLEAKKIFADRFSDVVPFSAKKSLMALEKSGEIDLHHRNLLEVINSCFYKEAMRNRLAIKNENSRALVTAALDNYNSYINKLVENNDRRLKLIEDLDSDVSTLKEEIRQSINTLEKTLASRIEDNIEQKTSSFLEIKNEEEQEKYFSSHIIESDYLRNSFIDFFNRYEKRCIGLRNRSIKAARFTEFKFADFESDNKNLFSKLDSKNIDKIAVKVTVDDGIENSSIIAGVLGALLLASPVGLGLGALAHFSGASRWLSLQYNGFKMKNTFNANKKTILRNMKIKTSQNLDGALEVIVRDVCHVREDSFSKLHGLSSHYNSSLMIGRDIGEIASKKIEVPSLTNLLLRNERHEHA